MTCVVRRFMNLLAAEQAGAQHEEKPEQNCRNRGSASLFQDCRKIEGTAR